MFTYSIAPWSPFLTSDFSNRSTCRHRRTFNRHRLEQDPDQPRRICDGSTTKKIRKSSNDGHQWWTEILKHDQDFGETNFFVRTTFEHSEKRFVDDDDDCSQFLTECYFGLIHIWSHIFEEGSYINDVKILKKGFRVVQNWRHTKMMLFFQRRG